MFSNQIKYHGVLDMQKGEGTKTLHVQPFPILSSWWHSFHSVMSLSLHSQIDEKHTSVCMITSFLKKKNKIAPDVLVKSIMHFTLKTITYSQFYWLN